MLIRYSPFNCVKIFTSSLHFVAALCFTKFSLNSKYYAQLFSSVMCPPLHSSREGSLHFTMLVLAAIPIAMLTTSPLSCIALTYLIKSFGQCRWPSSILTHKLCYLCGLLSLTSYDFCLLNDCIVPALCSRLFQFQEFCLEMAQCSTGAM